MAKFFRSNPMPTTGALFVTNPRRRKRRNAWAAPKDELRMRAGRYGQQIAYHPAHSEAAASSAYARRGSAWLGTDSGKEAKKVQRATIRLKSLLPKTAKGKGRDLLTKTQIKEIVKKNSVGLTDKLIEKLTIAADGRKYSRKEAQKNIIKILKESKIDLNAEQEKLKPKKRSSKARINKKEKGMLAFSNPRRRKRRNLRKRKKNGLAMVRKNALKLNRRRKRKASKRKLTAYQRRWKAAMKKTGDMKKAHRLARRKNAVKKVNRKRKNAIKLNSRKRKNSTTKRRRKNAIKLNRSTGRFNPRRRRNSVSKYRRRRNQAQPILNVALGKIEDIQKTAKGFPLVSFVAFAITPLALGAGVYYVHKAVEPVLMPALKPLAKYPVIGAVVRNPYLTTGLVVGLGLNLLAGTKMGKKVISPAIAAKVGGLAVAMGVGLDLSLKSFAQAATEVAQEVAPQLAAEDVLAAQDAALESEAEALDEMEVADLEVALADEAIAGAQAAALTNGDLSGYGDGGFYAIGANSRDLGALASEYGALASEYGDAKGADAFVCTPIMHPSEVSAAMAGGQFWRKKFGRSPKRMRGQRTRQSRHAGRMGHRYGWLIRQIGFKRFQQIAALPASKRAAVIRSFQQKAKAAEPVRRAQVAAEAQLAETASMPVAGAANGAQGFNGVGYGALMFSGAGY